MNKDISFVIISCDKYNDLWDIFFSNFRRYWPDCNLPVYLVTNYLEYNNPKITNIIIGEDISYTDNLLKAVSQIDSEWILVWLEDCMFSDYIDNKKVTEILQQAIDTPNLGYLKLSNDLPLSYTQEHSLFFGKIPKGVKYRSAVGMALYRKDLFYKLFVSGENAWQADKSDVSDSLPEDFYALSRTFFYKPLFPYINTVVKGRWSKPAVRMLSQHGFSKQLKSRFVQTLYGYLYEKVFNIWSFFLQLFKIYWYK